MPADSLRFSARWSRAVGIITVGVIVVVVIVDIVLVRSAYTALAGKASRVLPILGALFLTGMSGVIALFAPRSYAVGSEGIVIHRFGLPVVIAYGDIQELRRIDAQEIGSTWRTFGSGGFLGWFGWFYSRSLGKFLAYATNQRDLVLVRKADGSKVVISPYPPDAFLDAVQRSGKRPA